jgi:hypothetical protein
MYNNAKKVQAKDLAQEKVVQEREANFKLLRKQLSLGKLTLDDYLDDVQDLYKFVPKKKYTEELEDTSESDPEEDNGSEEEDNTVNGFTTEEQESIDRFLGTSDVFGISTMSLANYSNQEV